MHFHKPTATEVRQQFASRQHQPVDLLLAGIAAAGLFVTSMIAGGGAIPAVETSLFRTINNWPDWLFPIIWPFMQYGVFVTIPIAALVATYFRQYRLAILLLLGGVGIYFLALVVKESVERLRPVDIYAMLQAREQTNPGSLGFPSGHTAVASTIATFAHRYLLPRWQKISIFTLVVVLIGRIYVGAHLPLDVFGGLFLGVLVASLINFLVGVPAAARQARQ